MTKLEEVARAMKANMKKQLNGQPLPGSQGDPTNWSATSNHIDLEELARAALAALREPTEAMLGPGTPPYRFRPSEMRELWSAMIDAVLKEKA